MPTYQSPGVYIEEVAGGLRPVQASGTTSTGFVGVLELPVSFGRGLNTLTSAAEKAKYTNLLMPKGVTGVAASWSAARAFLPLAHSANLADLKAQQKPTPASLDDFAKLILGKTYSAPKPLSDQAERITLSPAAASATENALTIEADKTLVNLVEAAPNDLSWNVSLAVSENPRQLLDAVAHRAIRLGQAFAADLPGTDGNQPSLAVEFDALRNALFEPGFLVTGMDSFHTWRREFGRKLFEALVFTRPNPDPVKDGLPTKTDQIAELWLGLGDDIKEAWHAWLRTQMGMRLLEISLGGFFGNGGTAAFLGMTVVSAGTDLATKTDALKKWFDTVGDTAILVAPGLNKGWQEAILTYSRQPPPSGRGDIFAILDTPRYLLTQPPLGTSVDAKDRSVVGNATAYALPELELLAAPTVPALRHNPNDTQMDLCVPRDPSGFGAAYAPWFIARNPIATGPEDGFVVAPPSGFIAGAYGLNDNSIGVHKVPANMPVTGIEDMVCSVTGVEQNPLNVKGINVVRFRPGGILIWGGRTTATDPLWRYVNVRRVFLFIERSVRDAVQWAVFQPNNSITRSDLAAMISGFLYAQWQRGTLDGGSSKEAFFVQCNEENNPIATRKAGFLNVDVGIQPPSPAEFVVIRFRQQA